MNDEAKKYYDEDKSIFGLPQLYRGLELYPLKIKDFYYHDLLYSLFSYPQSAVSNKHPEVYKMSYLKFCIYILEIITNPNKEIKTIEEKLKEFMNFITKRRDIEFIRQNKQAEIEDQIITMKVGGKTFVESDFQNIREIILEQNGTSIEYVNEYNEELEKDLEFAYKSTEKYDFKDQVFALGSLLHKSTSEISDYTLYELKNSLESASALQAYLIQTVPLTEVGKDYTFQSFMKHLKNKRRYEDILEDVEKFKKESSYFKSEQDIAR